MTTIAYKDGVIAYDSRVTRGDFITDDDRNGVMFFLRQVARYKYFHHSK